MSRRRFKAPLPDGEPAPSGDPAALPLGSIIAGDCRSVMADWPTGSVDLVFADPPYNLSGRPLACIGNTTGGDWHKVDEDWDRMSPAEYREFTRQWVAGCARLLKPTGALFACATCHSLGAVLAALEESGLQLKNLITWRKTNAMPSMTRRVFKHSTEFVAFAVKGPGYTFNYQELKVLVGERRRDTGELRQMSDVWEMPVLQGPERLRAPDGRAAHPTQKPEKLVERCVAACSKPGEIVFDPFMGTGTTAAVAARLGRRWLGIERDAGYRELAQARLQAGRNGPSGGAAAQPLLPIWQDRPEGVVPEND